MTEGLGIIIDESHGATINSFAAVPMTFGAGVDVPPRWVPPLIVESQGRTNSCAGHAEALAANHSNFTITGEVLRFSRWFAYITAQLCGGFRGDQGTSIGSTLDAATRYGVCLEATCPFTEAYSQQLSKAAYTEAEQHKHLGETRYDCRDWETAIQWLTDQRPIIIGTSWYSGQDSCGAVEDRRTASGSFRGYHARCLVGWDTLNGELCPVVQNSHGASWGANGRAVITSDLWHSWQQDHNFFAFGFGLIDEVEPQRRSYLTSKAGDSC